MQNNRSFLNFSSLSRRLNLTVKTLYTDWQRFTISSRHQYVYPTVFGFYPIHCPCKTSNQVFFFFKKISLMLLYHSYKCNFYLFIKMKLIAFNFNRQFLLKKVYPSARGQLDQRKAAISPKFFRQAWQHRHHLCRHGPIVLKIFERCRLFTIYQGSKHEAPPNVDLLQCHVL